jgi:hypothetical protein
MFDTLRQDVRFGFRMLRATPALTLTAILSLALGIGASRGAPAARPAPTR